MGAAYKSLLNTRQGDVGFYKEDSAGKWAHGEKDLLGVYFRNESDTKEEPCFDYEGTADFVLKEEAKHHPEDFSGAMLYLLDFAVDSTPLGPDVLRYVEELTYSSLTSEDPRERDLGACLERNLYKSRYRGRAARIRGSLYSDMQSGDPHTRRRSVEAYGALAEEYAKEHPEGAFSGSFFPNIPEGFHPRNFRGIERVARMSQWEDHERVDKMQEFLTDIHYFYDKHFESVGDVMLSALRDEYSHYSDSRWGLMKGLLQQYSGREEWWDAMLSVAGGYVRRYHIGAEEFGEGPKEGEWVPPDALSEFLDGLVEVPVEKFVEPLLALMHTTEFPEGWDHSSFWRDYHTSSGAREEWVAFAFSMVCGCPECGDVEGSYRLLKELSPVVGAELFGGGSAMFQYFVDYYDRMAVKRVEEFGGKDHGEQLHDLMDPFRRVAKWVLGKRPRERDEWSQREKARKQVKVAKQIAHMLVPRHEWED